MHIGAYMLRHEYICENRVGCLQWDRGVGGAEQAETGAGKIEGSERVPQACPGSDGSPDNLLCNGLPLSLWVLWNCRPALYSWGLRGDKRPFNSERREVTEREALREGYQSDIHHTNLSPGTGPAKEGPWRWSWAYMCAHLWGWGDTTCRGREGGEGKKQSVQVSRLPRCRVEGSGAAKMTAELGCGGQTPPPHAPSVSHIYLCTCSRFIFSSTTSSLPFKISFQLTVQSKHQKKKKKMIQLL